MSPARRFGPGRARRFETWLNFRNRPLVFVVLGLVRRLGPVVRVPGLGHMVNDDTIARAILLDPIRFNSHDPGSFGHMITRVLGPAALINMDGAAHQDLKRQLLAVFSSQYVAAVTEQAGRAMVDELRRTLVAGGTVDLADFMQHYAGALACALIGIRIDPAEARRAHAEMFGLATAIMALVALRRPALRPHEAAQVAGHVRRLGERIRTSYEDGAGPALSVTRLLREQGLSFEAVEALVAVIFVGATELIGYGLPRLVAVLIDSGAMQALAVDPDLIERAIDEGFRVVTPSNAVLRAVAEDVVVGGHRFRKGDRVLVVIRNILRRHARFADPDSFDLHRTIPAPLRRLAFGAGTHACLGIGLAVAEARQVIGTLAGLEGRLVIGRRRCHRGQLYPGYESLVLRLLPAPSLPVQRRVSTAET